MQSLLKDKFVNLKYFSENPNLVFDTVMVSPTVSSNPFGPNLKLISMLNLDFLKKFSTFIRAL